MLDAGDFAVHIVSGAAREKYFPDARYWHTDICEFITMSFHETFTDILLAEGENLMYSLISRLLSEEPIQRPRSKSFFRPRHETRKQMLL